MNKTSKQFNKWDALVVLGVFGLIVLASQATADSSSITRSSNNDSGTSKQIAFLKNMGQWQSDVLYQGSDDSGAVQFLPNAISFALGREVEDETELLVFNLNFLNNTKHTITNSGETPSKINYLKGGDRAKWVIGTPQTKTVTYNNIYSKIDLAYYTQGKALKYDFTLKPGAQVQDIRLQYEGIRTLEIDSAGDLLIHYGWGTLTDKAPIAYQIINGQKKMVPVQYSLFNKITYGFKLGAYNPNYDLIIDPLTLVWSTFMGVTEASVNNYAHGIAIDKDQDVYIVGMATDTFPTTPGSYQPGNGGFGDAFVTKLKNDGTGVEYSTFLGGDNSDTGYGIAVNTAKEAYITGYTRSANFPVTAGTFQSGNNGLQDVFLTKLNALGTGLVYSTYLGGEFEDIGYDLAIDATGNAYITGGTFSTNFPVTLGAFQAFNALLQDAFVVKVNPLGTGLVYSTYLGGEFEDESRSIALDAAGQAYVTGNTNSVGFPTTAGAFQRSNAGNHDTFATKLKSDGTGLVYSTLLGGGSDDYGHEIVVDAADNAYLTGYTASSSINFPTTAGAFQTINRGFENAFVTKLKSDGTGLEYSTLLGGDDVDEGYGLALNKTGEAYITGYARSTNFPVTSDAYQKTNAGKWDLFVTHLSTDGKTLACGGSTYIGGSRNDYWLPKTTLDPSDTYLYTTGTTHSDDFPIQDRLGVTGPTADVYYPIKSNPGDWDQPLAFKMKTCGADVILAVHWDYYKATCQEKNNILIEWSTLEENNTLGFIVQWANNASGPFVDVSPAIRSKGPYYPYQWLDTAIDASPFSPQSGIYNWYRIRELTLDGPGDTSEPFTTPDICK